MRLADFQRDFAQALFDGDAGALAELAQQPGFTVYRNTVHKGCIDALEANFPSVASLVGSEWFRAAAHVFLQTQRPTDGRLLRFGAGFARFLADFEPATELPYLPGVAQLDAMWIESHTAADATPLHAQVMSALSPEALGGLRLQAQPATRWAWFDAPVYSIWSRERGDVGGDDIAWQPEGALLTRVDDQVQWQPASRAACALLDACARGEPLGDAAEHALATDPGADLTTLLAELLRQQAFASTTNLQGHP